MIFKMGLLGMSQWEAEGVIIYMHGNSIMKPTKTCFKKEREG
jgi:hypothetical protein